VRQDEVGIINHLKLRVCSKPAVLDRGGSVDAVAGLFAKALQPGESRPTILAAALHDLAGD
jgi:hypothetical protein